MSTYRDSDNSLYSFIFSFHNIFRNFRFHWKSVSGFNTQSPYNSLAERTLFRKRNTTESALFESFDILAEYIDDLLQLQPGEGNHDINLKTQLEIKKTELYPLLPDSCKNISYDERGILFSVYRSIIIIHSDLLRLQDQFQLMADFSPFLLLLQSEKTIVNSVSSLLKAFCQSGEYEGKVNKLFFEALDNFKVQLTELKKIQYVNSGKIEQLQVMKNLTSIGESNERLRNDISGFPGRGVSEK